MALLDADFVRELELLKRRLDVRARSGHAGEHTSKRRGSSTEFAEHRHYVPGDDLRRIDWFAYARSGEPMLKQFRADEDSVARVLVDHSASMAVGTPSKLDAAKKLAAAIGYLWLGTGQRFQLVGQKDDSLRPYNARRGQRSVPAAFAEVEALVAGGKTDLAGWVRRLLAGNSRPGLLVTISDFFDPGPVLSALDQARAMGHQVAMLQVLAPEELDPTLDGDLRLVDSETGDQLEVSIDAAALQAYGRRLTQLTNELQHWARRSGQVYARVASDGDLGDAIQAVAAPDLRKQMGGAR